MIAHSFKGEVIGPAQALPGGYAYDRRMVAELRELGWRPEVLNLGEGFPRPSALTSAAANAHLRDVPKGRPIVIDGLAFGVLPEAAETLSVTHPLIALVHHPLALETGLTPEEASALRESECRALSFTHGVVANSAATARALAADYGVPADRITVAPPGTDRAPAIERHHSGPVALLAVGAVVKRKGYDVLVG